MAEAVFRSKCPCDYVVDSAGTAGYHIGKAPDSRTISTLEKNGLSTTHKAQQLVAEHFHEFDYIVCMDQSNYNDTADLQPRKSKAKCN